MEAITDKNNTITDNRTEKRKIGDAGEDIAVAWLVRHGYRIVARNYLCKCGELDIIAALDKEKILAFIEVKSRNTLDYGLPCESVSAKKQQRLRHSAELYLIRNSCFRNCYQPRMDIVELLRLKDEIYLRHLKNAF